jgi:hypothetical protein
MGYNTKFTGTLKFTKETPLAAIPMLKDLIDTERTPPDYGNNYIGIVIKTESGHPIGIAWNDECEKTYGMVETVNFLLDSVRVAFPGFGLEGSLLAQGEEIGDVWHLIILDGKAVERRVQLDDLLTCPECGHQWRA